MYKARYLFVFLIILSSLFSFACHSDNFQGEKRTVYLKVVADKEFAFFPKWEKLIKSAISKCSKQFNSQMGIKFEIKKIEEIEILRTPIDDSSLMPPEVERAYYNLLEADKEWLLNNVDFEDCDIIICFSGQDYRIFTGSIDDIPGRLAVVVYLRNNFKRMVRTLVHEMGHLFGADHLCNNYSVMFPFPEDFDILKFDSRNRNIILKNKWRDFTK